MKTFFTWMNSHRILAGMGIILVMIGGYYFFFRSTETAVTSTDTTVTVARDSFRVTVTGSGQVAADSQVDLKPVAAGDAIEVTAVMVKNDQEVKKGQLIATIDAEDASRDVRQAELSLKSAKIKMQQTAKEYAARNEDETLVRRSQEVSVAQQELALEKAVSKLADYSIRAPFDGIVTGLDVDGGDTISQTTVLASVISKEMKATITLNEVDAAKVKVGDMATLSFAALPNLTVSGKLAKIDTIGKASSGVVSYGAEIVFEQQESTLRPGMSVTADIIVEEKMGVLVVPNEALVYSDGQAYVRVPAGAEDVARSQKKKVTVGSTNNIVTEIESGVRENDIVILTSAAGTAAASTANQSGGFLNSLLRSGSRSNGR